MTEKNMDRTGVAGVIQRGYRRYREAQKRRGRQRNAKRKLQQAVAFYGRFVRPGQLCFDVGANVGNRSRAFLHLGARVVAIEPQPDCARALEQEFGGNSDFTLVTQALDSRPGNKEMFISNASTLSSMCPDWIESVQSRNLFPGCTWDRKITVETTTLDLLVQAHGVPDFCKIDVEGFELDVLKGLSRPIPLISFEYTEGVFETALHCMRHLASLGDARFNYSQGESLVLAWDEWVDYGRVEAALEERDKAIRFGDIYVRFEDVASRG